MAQRDMKAGEANAQAEARGQTEAGAQGEANTQADNIAPEESPACYDYADFFRRTSVKLDSCILATDGKIKIFSDDLVIRYLESVTVRDDGYDILFKCGLKVRVLLGRKK